MKASGGHDRVFPCEVEHQLGFPFDRNEGVAVAQRQARLRVYASFLFPDVRPDFVAFTSRTATLSILSAMIVRTSRRRAPGALGSSCVDFGDPLHARTLFLRVGDGDHLSFLDGQVHAVQVFFTRLLKPLGALAALIALVTFAVASFALTFGPARMAGHGVSS